MVDQYTQQVQNLEQQRQDLQRQQQQIQSQRLPLPSASQLLQQGIPQMLARQQAEQQFENSKQPAISQLQSNIESYGPVIEQAKTQQQTYNQSVAEQNEWKEAYKLARSGSRFEGTPSLRAKVNYYREQGVPQYSEDLKNLPGPEQTKITPIPQTKVQGVISTDYSQPVKTQPSFLQRFAETTQGKSIFGPQGVSVSGALEFIGNEAANKLATPVQKQSIGINDLLPYQTRGTMITQGQPLNKNTPISAMLSPEQLKQTQEIKQQLQKTAISQTVQTSPYIVGGLIGGPVATGGLGALSFLTSAEKIFSPKGSEELQKQTKENFGGVPVPYVLPAIGLVAGAIGIGQAYKQLQLDALQKANPELMISQPRPEIINGKETGRVIVESYGVKRIPAPGFSYTPKQEIQILESGEVSPTNFYGISRQAGGPRLDVYTKTYLSPTQSGEGFWLSDSTGQAQLRIQNMFTGKLPSATEPATAIQNFNFGGFINPADARIIRINNIEDAKATEIKPIDRAYVGELKVTGENNIQLRQNFGGVPIKQLGSTDVVISGPIKEARLYPISERGQAIPIPKLRGLLEPRTFGFYGESLNTPENSFSLLPPGKKAQAMLDFEIPRPSADFEPSVSISPKKIMFETIGSRVTDVSSQLFKLNDYASLSLPTNPSLELNKNNQFNIVQSITSSSNIDSTSPSLKVSVINLSNQIPKTAFAESPLQINNQVPVSIPLQTPGQLTTQMPTTTTAQVPKQISIVTPMVPPPYIPLRPVFGIPPSIPFGIIKRNNKKKLRPVQGFEVQVRKKGKFVPTTGMAYSKEEALALGTRAVTQGRFAPQATFRLVPSSKSVSSTGLNISTSLQGFRAPKRPTSNPTFIQVKSQRIKTPGEISGISKLGGRPRGIKNTSRTPTYKKNMFSINKMKGGFIRSK